MSKLLRGIANSTFKLPSISMPTTFSSPRGSRPQPMYGPRSGPQPMDPATFLLIMVILGFIALMIVISYVKSVFNTVHRVATFETLDNDSETTGESSPLSVLGLKAMRGHM